MCVLCIKHRYDTRGDNAPFEDTVYLTNMLVLGMRTLSVSQENPRDGRAILPVPLLAYQKLKLIPYC